MSNNKCVEWAWRHQGTTPGEKLILLYLATNATRAEDGSWECTKGYGDIGRGTGACHYTAVRNCKSLVSKHIVSIKKRGEGQGIKNIYRLNTTDIT